MKENCIFCDIIGRRADFSLVYEDELCMAITPLKPIYDGAVVLFPKAHVDHFTDLSEDLAAHMMRVFMRIANRVRDEYECERVGMNVHGYGVAHAHINLVPQNHPHDITSRKFASIVDGDIEYSLKNLRDYSRDELDEIAKKIRVEAIKENKFEQIYHDMMNLSDVELIKQLNMVRPAAKTIPQILDIKEGESILDLCCGSGGLSCLLADQGFNVTGIDFVARALDVGRRIQNLLGCSVNFREGDITDRNDLPKSADIILLCDVVFPSAFSHAGNDLLVSNLADCLAPEGRIFIEAYNKEYCIESGFETYKYCSQSDHFTDGKGDSVILYDVDEIQSLFAKYGLSIEKCGGWNNFLGEKGVDYQSQADFFIVRKI